MKKEDLEEFSEEEEKEHWLKGPLKLIIALFLILIILLWFIPVYAIKIDPSPSHIPKISEVVLMDISPNETYFRSISKDLVNGRDPIIKEVADRIAIDSCKSYSKICHAKAIFYFVQNNFNYVPDPTAFEYIKTAKQSLRLPAGDCDDGSVLIASLLDAVGIKSRFVFIPRHVYIQAYLPEARKKYKAENDWVNLDVTCFNCEFGEIPYKNQESKKRYL